MLGKGRGVDDAKGEGQGIKQWLGEIALNSHLLGSAPCSKQREAKQKEPTPYNGRLKV
jgi:hypothetical protein